jgi:ribose 1,5-bisphosphokinase PhnN
LPKIDSLIIVGSTCSGKTSLVRSLREFYKEELIIPLRYITRPQRKNDDLVENQPVPTEVFQGLIADNKIDVWWKRPMEGDRIELYGFETVTNPENKLRIYSANNAILRDKEAHIKNVGTYKVLAIKADHKARAKRLHKRSPDLKPEEVEYRLGDDGSDVINMADYVIDNSEVTLEEIFQQTKEIIDSIIKRS